MSVTAHSQFDVLHALRVKGLASPAILAALTGIPVDSLPGACAPLVQEGLVIVREGAMAGYLPTQAGKERAAALLADDEETRAAGPELTEFDAAFLPLNSEFKQVCQRWQVRESARNEHTDAAYDAGVVASLAEIHERLLPLLSQVPIARFARYEPRFAAALERVQAGDVTAFARPMADSYHDIWMELHNDVVLSLGRERGAGDEH